MVTGWKHLKSPKKEASMAKTAKVTFIIIFLPTLLHDLAASRQVKTGVRNDPAFCLGSSIEETNSEWNATEKPKK